jgi:hypothetical protein
MDKINKLHEEIKLIPKITITRFEIVKNEVYISLYTIDLMGYKVRLNCDGQSVDEFDPKKFMRSVNKSILNRQFDEPH